MILDAEAARLDQVLRDVVLEEQRILLKVHLKTEGILPQIKYSM